MVTENRQVVIGGGIFAYDVPKSMGRVDYKLQNSNHEIETIHILERYDLGDVYEIVDQKNCVTVPVKGKIVSPFDWIAQAQYNGTTKYHGKDHDVWVLETNEQGSDIKQQLFVDSSNVDTPVYYTQRNVTDKDAIEIGITYLSFEAKEPQDWVFAIPTTCKSNLTNLECNSNAVVYWANSNWNCGDVSCSYRVPEGSGQPGYECAEFTARALAAGGYVDQLGPNSPQSAFADISGINLLYVSGLNTFFTAVGTYSRKSSSASAVQATYAILGDGGDGSWSHACIGIGPGVDDCHNNARQNWPASGSFYAGVDAVWAPPGC